MQCPRCQHENAADAAFCDECGARLEAVCSGCGESNRSGAKFCRKCGQALSAAAPNTPSPSPFDSPQAYTPRHLAEKILTSKAALEGERKQVTVLFADLKGSMELLADRDPEEARKILDPVLERMMEAVHRYEGTVNQVMGDGIMALFGAPLAHEDHAVRACYAALRIQDSVKGYAEEVRRSHGATVQVRVGLNSGEVVVRAIGGDLHMDYTAVGQTTHLAARMEQAATPGSIVITADTLRLGEGFVQVRSLGSINVKGLSGPVDAFELVGAGSVRSRLQAAAARGLTRFVGRDAEVEQLRRARDLAAAGHGQVVAVGGEPGVGKSRLFWEFTHSSWIQDWLILESSSVSHGKATPYLPIADLLRTYFRVEVRDDAQKIRERVTSKLVTLDQTLMLALPAFLTLLDAPGEDGEWQALDSRERRQRTLEALKRVVLREAEVRPLMLVFEDLQWIDSETQAFLDSLVGSLPTSRLLLLVNYRPEYQHAWGGKGYYTQLRIDPLLPESAEELLHALLGDDDVLTPLKRVLTERTEGNPFFLEESVRTLVETKALEGERGSYRLVRRLDAVQVPATVQAVLAARIDRLPEVEKTLLQTASVIGKDVPFALLQAIADLPDAALRMALTTLQTAEFLYEARLFPDLEYTFKHALTHDVAYEGLLQDRRRLIHGHIVEVIEGLHADRLPEWIDTLAHHAVRGTAWDKAFGYLRQAGAKAMARSAYQEAGNYFEQALDAGRHLSQDRSLVERTIDLRFDLRGALVPLARFQRALDHLGDARTLAEALNDKRRLGRIAAYMATCFRSMGEHAQAIECGLRALGLAKTLDDFALQVAATFYLGEAYASVADYPRAIQHLAWSIEHVRGDLLYERFGMTGLPAVLSRAWLVRTLADQGEFAAGRVRGAEGLGIANAAEQPFDLVVACWGLGSLHLQQGETGAAIPFLERGVHVAERQGIPGWASTLIPTLGYAYALAGRLDEAIPLLVDGLHRLAATRGPHALFTAWLSEVYLWAGRVDEALRLAADALDIACRRGERGYEAVALHVLGDIAALADPPEVDVATRRQGEAIALAERLGTRPLLAHCHLGLGKLYRRTDQREQAHEHLSIATTMYREMDMRFYLEQAAADLAALG